MSNKKQNRKLELIYSGKMKHNIDVQFEGKIGKSIEDDFALLMQGKTSIVETSWEMQGEYYKQFSLYQSKFDTKVSNKI